VQTLPIELDAEQHSASVQVPLQKMLAAFDFNA
jgi:hypothetical protein